jgi:DNA-binding transcriptional LysR family regulator
MHVTLRQLRVLDRVARHLSITRAAEDLHLTQPAVSMQLRQLEAQVGMPLVEQLGKKLYLTDAGAELWQHARRVLGEVDDLIGTMKARRGLQHGRVRLAVVATANYFVPGAIAAFRRRHPHLGVELFVGNRQEVFTRLSDNAIDLAVAGQPLEELDCEAQAFLDNPLVAIAAADHPLAARKRIGLAELAMHPLVLREPGSGTRAAALRLFAEHGLDARIVSELPSVEAVKQAVQAGLGVGVVSRQAIELEVAAGRLTVLSATGFPMRRQWFVIHRRGKPLSAPALAFRETLLSVSGRNAGKTSRAGRPKSDQPGAS